MRIHITGMENVKGQQNINAILDSMNNEIDNHKWTVTTQDYTNLKFEKYLESGSTLTVDQKPKANIPIVGTHNGRKVYIGDLDVQGNIVVKDLNLRDNITTSSKSWTTITSGSDGTLVGDWWNSETFNVGKKTSGSLVEVKSIPNDIKDPRYGSTINNGITYTASGSTIDTRTYEKVETSCYIAYPIYNVVVDGVVTETNKQILDDWRKLGDVEVPFMYNIFPQITVTNAEACWATNQIYGLFKFEAIPYSTFSMLRFVSWRRYNSYEEYYKDVAKYPDLHGRNGYGMMIPSWRFIEYKFGMQCRMAGNSIYTRRILSEEFEGKNSGIVKVDVSYRI